MKIRFNFSKELGKIKKMHGVGQPPFYGVNDSMFHYLTEAGIPYSRLHDVGGYFGGNRYVDIHNIFRDFDKDENDEANYDFGFTDWLLTSLRKHGVEPIYRLGETIENYHYIKTYRIFPPKDPAKWARICEHIIRHYNYGWANGYHLGIKYFEIWNEPDNGPDDRTNEMWHGTKEQYFELYTVTAKHLKAVFGDEIKVGGYASCGFKHIFSDPEKYGVKCEKLTDECFAGERGRYWVDFFEDFFGHIKRENAPLDFFSWHSYLSTERTLVCAEYVERRLEELGFGDVETQLNEWNNAYEDMADRALSTKIAKELKGTPLAAARAMAMMCAMQNTKTDVLCYYDAGMDPSFYRGMFNPLTHEPLPLYYSFVAFNELYKLGTQIESEGASDGVWTLAAKGEEGIAAVVTNTTDRDIAIETNLNEKMEAYVIEEGRIYERSEINPQSFALNAGSIVLFK